MRKFKTCSRRSLPFRLLVILAGALLLLAAFAPRANADCPACIRFYDFEGPAAHLTPLAWAPNPPALEQGAGRSLRLPKLTTERCPYSLLSIPQPKPGLPLNVPPGAHPNLTSLGIHRSGAGQFEYRVPFFSATGIYDIQSVSFAIAGSGNGFQNAQLQIEHRWRSDVRSISSAPHANPQRP